MNITETTLPGVLLITPKVFGDARGFFVETYRAEALLARELNLQFVQDNQSRSVRGTLRGLHHQYVQPQGKLVRVSAGRVFDVAVDVRRGSPTFGQHVAVVLDDVSHQQMFIPPGFAHGFCVLSETADFVYKCTDYYHPAGEAGVRFDDPALGIQWPAMDRPYLLSDKDAALPLLVDQGRLP
ncbi:dTDP-4-dehydrorhamnose 3,5-epimerase [Polycyclovorans algicola]|uniref:dTDP-4-dehydrorhamnose 3,5-epimerase n=1 Tax=Polycyclovorans algicola TaxID=616992 RepID=UPI0004A6EAFE|nr:dTDP-4-dehydrorhamnose 3,5-epimerase [Polycyclovorans algicola]